MWWQAAPSRHMRDWESAVRSKSESTGRLYVPKSYRIASPIISKVQWTQQIQSVESKNGKGIARCGKCVYCSVVGAIDLAHLSTRLDRVCIADIRIMPVACR